MASACGPLAAVSRHCRRRWPKLTGCRIDHVVPPAARGRQESREPHLRLRRRWMRLRRARLRLAMVRLQRHPRRANLRPAHPGATGADVRRSYRSRTCRGVRHGKPEVACFEQKRQPVEQQGEHRYDLRRPVGHAFGGGACAGGMCWPGSTGRWRGTRRVRAVRVARRPSRMRQSGPCRSRASRKQAGGLIQPRTGGAPGRFELPDLRP